MFSSPARSLAPFLLLVALACSFTTELHAQTDARRVIRIALPDRSIEAQVLNRKKSCEHEPDVEYYWCSGQRILRTQGGAAGDLLDGDYREFHTNGQLMAQGSLRCGVRDGLWKEWDMNGHLLSWSEWKKGRRHGTTFIADPKGGEGARTRYKNGKAIEEKAPKEERERNKNHKADRSKEEVPANTDPAQKTSRSKKKKASEEVPAEKKKERKEPTAPDGTPKQP